MSAPYQAHSQTSREAAQTLSNAEKSREKVLRVIRDSQWSGLTNDEVSEVFLKTGSYFSPRLIELERAGKIVKLIDTRKTRANKNANIYVATEYRSGREIIVPLAQKPKSKTKELQDRIKKLEKALYFIEGSKTFYIEQRPHEIKQIAKAALED